MTATSPVLLQAILTLWNEDDVDVVTSAWDAMETLSRFVVDTYMSRHINFIRSVLSSLTPPPTSANPLHGLTVKKGIAPLLPAFQYALLHGIPSQRVSASDGLGELVALSTETTLAPHVIKLTGPLIRIVGDRFPAEVKASILHTLTLLIDKCGRLLKPFLPQLQTTFVKHLQDPDSSVRWRSATGLSELMVQSARVEVVVNELLGIITGGSVEKPVISSVYISLSGMLVNREVGAKISPDVRAKVFSTALASLADDDEAVRKEAAHCLADCLTYLSPADLSQHLHQVMKDSDHSSTKAGQALALAYSARLHYDVISAEDREAASHHLQSLLKDEQEGVQVDSLISLGEWMACAGPLSARGAAVFHALLSSSPRLSCSPSHPSVGRLPHSAVRLVLSH